jgi:hypothetical protein
MFLCGKERSGFHHIFIIMRKTWRFLLNGCRLLKSKIGLDLSIAQLDYFELCD